MAFSQVTNSETIDVMARIDHVVGLCSVVSRASEARSGGDSIACKRDGNEAAESYRESGDATCDGVNASTADESTSAEDMILVILFIERTGWSYERTREVESGEEEDEEKDWGLIRLAGEASFALFYYLQGYDNK
jgi:hypothetical protein